MESVANKILVFDKEVREKVLEGIVDVRKAVQITMGPKGKNVGIFKTLTKYDEGGNPSIVREHVITKDGVSVAKEIGFSDKVKDFAAQVLIRAASDTCDQAGDGTTTAIVLAASIVEFGVKALNSGGNPVLIKRGIDVAISVIVEEIKKMAKPISVESKELDFVARVSANNDIEIGSVVAKAIKKVDKDGIVTAYGEVSGVTDDQITEGYTIDSGATSLAFIKDRAKERTVLKNPIVVVYEHTPSKAQEVEGICEMSMQSGRPLLLFCEDIEGEAAAFMSVNSVRGSIKCAVVKNPYGSDLRKDFFIDVATATGSTVISNDVGLNIERIDPDLHVGGADEITITKIDTQIVGGAGTKESVDERIKELSQRAKKQKDYQKTITERRIGRLKGLAAVITVGANSEVEVKEKMDRVEDAIWATRSALEEGIVSGGGSTYVIARKALEPLISGTDEESIGAKIVYDALKEPLRQIAINSGKTGDMEVEKVMVNKKGFGWNAITEKNENLIKSGIIDPAKVARVALQNSASVAGMLLTTECIIIKEDPQC
ncbi:MAG: chaperonin GroEL [Bacteroidales bacterium]